MAKSRAQQAAIAISMKKAGKKPKVKVTSSKKVLRKANDGMIAGPKPPIGVKVYTGNPGANMIWTGTNIAPAGTGKYSSSLTQKTYSTPPNTKVPIGTVVDGKVWDGYTYVPQNKKGGIIKAKKNGKVSSMAKKRR